MKKTIGVLTPLTDGFYFNGMLQGIHQAALERNTEIVYFQTYDSTHTSQYHSFLGTDYIDGWIVLLNAVTESGYIKKLEAMGRPIVCTPYAGGFTKCTTFTVDNEQGGYDAAKHLLQHGHRDIALVYSSSNEESILRYRGYLRALGEHGIAPRPEFLFDVPNLWEKYGAAAADHMQERGMPFSAVVVCSDVTSIGMLEVFIKLGIRVPEDLALVSFDNTDYARRFSLSSVAQPLYTRGQRMLEEVLQQTESPILGRPILVTPMELVCRHSCGCEVSQQQEGMEELYNSGMEIIEYLSGAIQRNHDIGRNLIKSDAETIRSLFWLSYTSYTWGCLALWTADKQLKIDSIYTTKAQAVLQAGQLFDEAAFPPPGLQDILLDDECLTVHTIRTEERNLGFIVLMGDIFDKQRSSKLGPLIHSITHTMDLVAYALEREVLYEEARERENRLEIVSSTTNDGIFDWDLTTHLMKWNRKINHILDHEGLIMHEDEFALRVHPDDLPGLLQSLELHYTAGIPFQSEFRMRKNQDEWIWIHAAGEAVRNKDRHPVRMIGSIVDITSRKKQEEEIHHIAYHDALTSLPNRRFVYDRIAEELTRGTSRFAIILLDLDRFKLVNDTLGHAAGDELLRRVASQLQSCVSPRDVVARLGGDEFLLMCPIQGDPLYAETMAGTILHALNAQMIIEGHQVLVTPSIGISFYPDHGRDRDTLIKHADIAMYQAKEKGKNRFCLYTPGMNTESLQKFTMETGLRGALEAGEFTLHYQPQIDLTTEKMVGMEALLRWTSPIFGNVPPDSFIPIAEETGLIIPISRWIFRQACLDGLQLVREGLPPLVVSVNISAVHLSEYYFSDDVQGALAETGLPPQLLCLEITERAAIQKLEQSVQQLQALRERGVRIALDDFGVGHSSLSLIKKLPLDMIKIDRMFIRDIPRSEISTAILGTILALIEDLKLHSCIEGIETPEQYRYMREQARQLAQGYHICRPVPWKELRRLLRG
ncbi:MULTISPECIES: EAL domain-containing protein [Paenibacillus]|uniref:EAL domain-containing protein n=1 Tax=Paenibacillus TaxID=44249 RepID=UPI0022B8F6DA|nr:EAL domain-containing protein [Paenibacillus caseinilyticus]MCZ8518310.1 EAL domain-containing protein [Paenibacillus caseinilyticus]